MDKERLKLWVAALRSGEYAQTQGVLQRTNGPDYQGRPKGFCCLGVACEVAIKNGLEVIKYENDGVVFYNGVDTLLPEAVATWYGYGGLLMHIPSFVGVSATAYNDKLGKTFPEIADMIEEEYNLKG